MASAAQHERNLRLLTAFAFLQASAFWLPILFFFQLEVVGPAEVIALESAYYLANVIFEVPSGAFSDRIGRKSTLLLAGLAKVVGLVAFLAAETWSGLLLGQLGLAFASACVSGTDTSLLHESLRGVDRVHEQPRYEARFATLGYASLGIACALGGVVGSFSLRAAIGVALLFALAELATAALVRPTSEAAESAPGSTSEVGLGRGLWCALRAFSRPAAAWIVVYFVALLALDHVLLQLLQPMVAALLEGPESGDSLRRAPWISGALLAALFAISSLAAASGPTWVRRLGGPQVLGLAFALQVALPLGLALLWSPWALGLVLLRKVPQALSLPLLRSALHQRVPDEARATSFSVLSLFGSLCFASCLAGLAWRWGALDQLGSNDLRWALGSFALGGGLTALVLLATRGRANRDAAGDTPPGA